MSAVKFWDGSTWRTVTAIQGPPGPQGPGGLAGSPTDPAVGNQRVIGSDGLASPNLNQAATQDPFWLARGGIIIDGKADGSQPLVLNSITPAYNCWWPINAALLLRILDSVWYGANVSIVLSDANLMVKTDADGRSQHHIRAIHNVGASDWVTAPIACQYKLVAGETYRAQLAISAFTGGTWNYYRGGGVHCWIASPGVVAR